MKAERFTYAAQTKAASGSLTLGVSPGIRQVVGLNCYIMGLVVLSYYAPAAAYAGGVLLLFYLSMKALMSPFRTLLLLFGIKLTFDSLWAIEPVEGFGMSLKLTELFFVPVIMVIFVSMTSYKIPKKSLLAISFLFVIWLILAMIMNNGTVDIPLLIKLSGSLMGLLLGFLFVKEEDHLGLIMLLVFISTILPVLASLLQIIANYLGISMLYYMADPTRELRPSGLFFDPATTGMVNVLSLVTGTYLILTVRKNRKLTNSLIVFAVLTLFVNIAGGTRSIIIVSTALISLLVALRFKKMIKFIPLLIIIVVLGKPYMDKVTEKSLGEIKGKIEFSQILQEEQYGEMFTGRVRIWQDVWEKFNEGSLFQMLFGSAVNSNAHSSYFFLLLFLGWLGLLYYLFFHFFLIRELVLFQGNRFLKYIAMACLMAVLMIGFSATTVAYTSFQWIIYLIVGGVINIGTIQRRMAAVPHHIQNRNLRR